MRLRQSLILCPGIPQYSHGFLRHASSVCSARPHPVHDFFCNASTNAVSCATGGLLGANAPDGTYNCACCGVVLSAAPLQLAEAAGFAIFAAFVQFAAELELLVVTVGLVISALFVITQGLRLQPCYTM